MEYEYKYICRTILFLNTIRKNEVKGRNEMEDKY